MRLIDVDELGVGRCSKDVLPAAYCAGWNGLLGLIEKAPTVDAVSVVRCKDCASGMVSDNNKYIICCDLGVSMGFDDYCSNGKRKENKDG